MDRRSLAATSRPRRTWKHVRADGTLIDLAIYSRQLVHDDQPAVLMALMDITERKRAEARLAYMAQHDALTGLPNRNLLRQQMDEMLLHTRCRAEKVARAGARPRQFQGGQRHARPSASATSCCSGVAKRLRSTLREEDALARLGGDEFALVQSRRDAAARMRCCWRGGCSEAIGEPYLLEGIRS